MMSPPEFLPIAEMVPRRLYRLSSRNLEFGVWNSESRGFFGIRKKFGSRYVFQEYHWDTGAPFGTACSLEDIGVDLPEGIRLVNDLGTEDAETKRLVDFDRSVAEGGRGWFFMDTGDASEVIRPVCILNLTLKDWLEAQETVMPTGGVTSRSAPV